MYKYPLKTDQIARARLDEKAAIDGYEEANADWPNALTSLDVVREQANNHVNVALDMGDDNVTDDEEEYRARYVEAYVTAYATQVAERRAEAQA